ncbi:HNH endonuclease [Williamsia deligens]|uniref:HNH endonuclease n=1 Tax=Williamsia deligens TaxID=321325 RepID=UPI0027E367D5|nr:HNH endonuclease [Williamsia deligens]
MARDECCIKCGDPASWTDVHHIVFHSDGGPTTCDNGCLLCRTCHIAVHQHGWEIEMGPDRHPWIRPPATVDPRRELQPAYNRRTLRLDPIAA